MDQFASSPVVSTIPVAAAPKVVTTSGATISLALTGVITGLLVVLLGQSSDYVLWVLPGVLFGLGTIVYLRLHNAQFLTIRRVTVKRSVIWVFGSTVSHIGSVLVSWVIFFFLMGGQPEVGRLYAAVVLAGVMGATSLASWLHLVFKPMHHRQLVLFILAGGSLAALGLWLDGVSLRYFSQVIVVRDFFLLFVLWQAGMAGLMGYVLSEKDVITVGPGTVLAPSRSQPITHHVSLVFLTTGATVLGWVVIIFLFGDTLLS